MEATIKVIKSFGQIDGQQVIAFYLKTSDKIENIIGLKDQLVTIAPVKLKPSIGPNWIKYTREELLV